MDQLCLKNTHNMASLTLLGLSLLLLLLVYKYIIVPAFLSPLSKIPNAHFTSPLSTLWIASHRRNDAAGTRAIYAAHQKHGPAIRLGPNELSICTPGALRTIYIGGFEKDRWYLDAFVNFGKQNMVSMLEHKRHSVQKRMVSNLYSKSYLQSSEDLQTVSNDVVLKRFLPIMKSVADNGFEMDVLDFLQAVGMDFTSAYLFGLSNGTDFMNDVKYRQYWINDYQKFKTQLPAERAGGEVERSCLAMCEAAERFMNNSNTNSEKPTNDPNHPPTTHPVVYSRLHTSLSTLHSQHTKPSPRTTTLTAASEMLDHLIAGHETSGITLSYLLHHLSQRPDLQSRLRTELLTLSPPPLLAQINTTADNNIPTTSLPSPRAIDSLPLLDALLSETLRLHAAAPAQQPRLTPHSPTGTTIEGYAGIPGGVRVSANAYTLHREPSVFPDPEKWIPERWVDASAGKREEMKKWFWAFGSGGRMCLGSHFALQSTYFFSFSLEGRALTACRYEVGDRGHLHEFHDRDCG